MAPTRVCIKRNINEWKKGKHRKEKWNYNEKEIQSLHGRNFCKAISITLRQLNWFSMVRHKINEKLRGTRESMLHSVEAAKSFEWMSEWDNEWQHFLLDLFIFMINSKANLACNSLVECCVFSSIQAASLTANAGALWQNKSALLKVCNALRKCQQHSTKTTPAIKWQPG